METRLGSSVLGLLITGFDVAATRKKELEYVWAKPFRLTFVRFLFILARYMALLIHIIDISLTSVVTATFLRTKQAPERSCTMLVVFHTVSLNIMLLVLHSILMIRVFALYDRSFRMGVFLLILLVGGFAGSTVGILHALRQYPILGEFNETCLDLKALEKRSIQNPLLVFVTGELCFQFILHGLAFKRTAWDLPRVLFSRPALLSVLNRDGLKIFISMLVAMIAGSVAVLKKRKLVGFLFPLLMTLISVSGTRTILNLQSLHTSHNSTSSSEDRGLTTFVDFTAWDVTWDASTFVEEELERIQPRDPG